MARVARPWFRFYVEAFSDRKIRRLRPEQRWLWVAMLGAARESPMPGHLLIAPGVPMSRAELAEYADVTSGVVAKGIPLMASLGMVEIDGDLISLPNFTARQFESDTSTDRVRAHRERSKERSGNGGRNAPETETETETEKTLGDKSPEARKRARQLPPDWRPNDGHATYAAVNQLDLDGELAQFADHHRAKGSTMKDWDAAFRTWLRNAVKWRKGSAGSVRAQVDDQGRTVLPPLPGKTPWSDA